jgi:hypothetical protein
MNAYIAVAVVMAVVQEGEQSVAGRVQLQERVVNRMTAVTASSEPEWVSQKPVRSGNRAIMVWDRAVVAGGEQKSKQAPPQKNVTVQVFACESEADAKEQLRVSRQRLSIPGGAPLKDFADEAYIWENYNGRGATTIHCQSGAFMIWASGPSVDVTRRFAEYMIGSLGEQEGESGSEGRDP